MERRLQLQPRLQLLADMVPEGCRLADVGTDHGYLPVYLLQRRHIRGAVAADIGAEPLAHARRTAEAYGVEGIDFRLCDGLRDIAPDEVDTLVIAGMGGETIITILDAAPWTRQERRLVLQPQSKIRELTDWLQDNGYMLADAQLCLDAGKLYLILDVRGAAPQERMTAETLLLCRRDPLLPQYLAEQDARLRRAIAGMERADRQEVAAELRRAKQALEEIARYEEVVKAW